MRSRAIVRLVAGQRRYDSAGRRALLGFLASFDVCARELAALVGASPQALSALTTGATREPTLRLALALARHAGIAPHAWLEVPTEYGALTESTPVDHQHGTRTEDGRRHDTRPPPAA